MNEDDSFYRLAFTPVLTHNNKRRIWWKYKKGDHKANMLIMIEDLKNDKWQIKTKVYNYFSFWLYGVYLLTNNELQHIIRI